MGPTHTTLWIAAVDIGATVTAALTLLFRLVLPASTLIAVLNGLSVVQPLFSNFVQLPS